MSVHQFLLTSSVPWRKLQQGSNKAFGIFADLTKCIIGEIVASVKDTADSSLRGGSKEGGHPTQPGGGTRKNVHWLCRDRKVIQLS